jgi:membrane protein
MKRFPVAEIIPLIVATFRSWHADKAPRMGAALAYYITLSLGPMMVIVLAIAGVAFGAKAAEGRLVWEFQALVGHEGAKVVQSVIDGRRQPSTGILATVLGFATLFFGGSSAVSELRDALNIIWKVPEDAVCSHARSLFNMMKERLRSFIVVLVVGLVLLASVILNAWISAAGRQMSWLATASPGLIHTADWVISFVLMTALFACIFKYLPAVTLQWRDVAAGTLITSLLFTAGKYVLGAYLIQAGFADSYGAAGSLVVFLVWVYYSAQVVFLGAEFVRTYTLRFGSHVESYLPL